MNRTRRPLTGPDDPRHGRASTYVYHRCRCARCCAANAAADKARAQARKPLADDDPRHGTGRGYKTHRCRCGRCRRWNADAATARGARKAEAA